jgi:amino acid transporter
MPVSVIPALCKGWRFGCALQSFAFFFPFLFVTAAYVVLRINDPNWDQRIFRDPNFFFTWMPLIIGLGFAVTFAIALTVYDFYSFKLYKWWYSK